MVVLLESEEDEVEVLLEVLVRHPTDGVTHH